MTCRLLEVRSRAPIALAAPMARIITLTAVAALGLSEAPVHEPVHGRLQAISAVLVQRSGRDSTTTVAHLTIRLGEIRNEVHFAVPNLAMLDQGVGASCRRARTYPRRGMRPGGRSRRSAPGSPATTLHRP